MALKSSGVFVAYVPENRERRGRRRQLLAMAVVAVVASSTAILQAVSASRPASADAPEAFAYFPN